MNTRATRRPTGAVRAAFRLLARLRRAPAFHPEGLTCDARVEVTGPRSRPWGVEWMDRPGAYEATVRLSRGAGLPHRLPDALGLALRVHDAGGPGRPLDLLFTSCGRSLPGRCLPRLRGDATAGPYSTLFPYRFAAGKRHLAAVPRRTGRGTPGDPAALRAALEEEPLVFDLQAASWRGPWRTFAVLTVRGATPRDTRSTPAYDVFAHQVPGLAPHGLLAATRRAAYAGSRQGRGQD